MTERIRLFPSVLARAQLEPLCAAVDSRYGLLEHSHRNDRPADAAEWLTPGQKFAPTASSFTLGAVVSEQELPDLLACITRGVVGSWLQSQLSSLLACDLDQAWIRRQYAPGRYPPLHAPHGWHQDGALGFDFIAHPQGPYPGESLLPMVTCWIALGPCGMDAPGLEVIPASLDRLLAPAELSPERVEAAFKTHQLWRPVFQAGDALLFCGDILHRTYVAPHMTRERTSLELRFFAAGCVPARLSRDRFLALD